MDSWTSSSSCWIKHTDTPYWPFAAVTLTQRISSLLARSRSDGAHPDEHAVEYTVVFSVWEETMVQFWSSAKKTAAPFFILKSNLWNIRKWRAQVFMALRGNMIRQTSQPQLSLWSSCWQTSKLHVICSHRTKTTSRFFFSLSLFWIFNQTLFVIYL